MTCSASYTGSSKQSHGSNLARLGPEYMQKVFTHIIVTAIFHEVEVNSDTSKF